MELTCVCNYTWISWSTIILILNSWLLLESKSLFCLCLVEGWQIDYSSINKSICISDNTKKMTCQKLVMCSKYVCSTVILILGLLYSHLGYMMHCDSITEMQWNLNRLMCVRHSRQVIYYFFKQYHDTINVSINVNVIHFRSDKFKFQRDSIFNISTILKM